MKKHIPALAAVLATAALAAPAQSQIILNLTPFSFEVRGGLAFPRGDFASNGAGAGDIIEGVNTSYTVGVNATYHAIPLLGIYGGYTYSRFSAEQQSDLSMVDQGFNAGVRMAIPTPLIPIDPYLKAGVVYNSLGYESDSDDNGNADGASDRALGYEAGAGLGIGLAPKLSLTPQVTYTRIDGDWQLVEHVRMDVGLRLRL